MSTELRQSNQLTDAEIPWFLSATPGAVVVEASMEGCVPCRLMRPVMEKLAAEFSGRLVVVELDRAARSFHRAYDVERFPQLLFFVDGRYVDRKIGFEGADETRDAIVNFLAFTPGEPSAAELSFRAACTRAQARLDEIMKPAGDALAPHMATIAPGIEAVDAAIKREVAAGRLRAEDAPERRKTDYARLYAPFQTEIEALRQAQAEGLLAYDAVMTEAVALFAQHMRSTRPQTVAAACLPGQLFCTWRKE
jgi:thioredoxin-like negative regulator of GroEL